MNTLVDHPRAPSLFRLALSEAGYEFLRHWRTPAMVIPTLAFPLVFYVLFAIVLPGQWRQYDKVEYLLATYGVFGIIGPALFTFGLGLATERENGWLEMRRVVPLPISIYFASRIVMSLLFAFLVVALLSLAGVVLGGARFDPGTWLLLLAVLLLGTLPFCALGLWIGAVARSQSAVAIVNLVYLPMAVLSGLWMPLFAFPKLMQELAVIWPAWHLSQMALGVVGQLEGVRYLLHAGVLVVMSVLFLSLAGRAMQRA